MSGAAFKKMASRIEDMAEDIEDEVTEAAEDGLDATADTARANLEANDSVVFGELAGSIMVTDNPTSVPRKPSTAELVELQVRAEHAPYVEYGTGVFSSPDAPLGPYETPDDIPSENILEWVRGKPVYPTYYDTQEDVAWAIKQTIEAVGNRAHPYLRPSWSRHKPALIRDAKSGLRKSVRRL